MAVASVLDLVFRTRKEGRGVEETRSALDTLNGALAKVGLGAISVAGAFAALRAAVGLAQLGAAVDRADLALIAYTGSSEDAALATELVSQAADGALSHLAATQNAARLFSMGLADSAEEAARLTRVAIMLGTSMGRGPQEAFEDFTLMLANQSIPRLDTFGISGARVRQRMEELASQGIAPLDRQARFMIATMEEAETRLQALDSAGYQATTGQERLSASWQNAQQMIGQRLAPAVNEYADGLARYIDQQVMISELTEEFGVQMRHQSYYFEGELIARSADELRAWAEAQDVATEAGQNLARTVRSDLIPSLYESLAARLDPPPPPDLPAWREGLAGIAGAAESAALAFQNANSNLSGFISQQRALMSWYESGGLEMQEAAQGVVEAFQQGALTREEADELLRPLMAATLAWEEEVGRISMTDATRRMAQEWGSDWGAARSEIEGARQAIDTIPAEVRTAIEVAVTWQLAGAGVYGRRGYQHGGSFVVEGPPGPDRVPVAFMATAGERVSVETPRQQAAGGRGGMNIGTLILNSGLDMRAFKKLQYEFMGG